jgi:hypothetical protein
MNPYLERAGVRQDFYSCYTHRLRAALVPQLGGRYFARIEQRPLTDDRFEMSRARWIEVVRLSNQAMVTVVRLLCLADKYPGPDRDRFLSDRIARLRAGVNVVEIDLIRGGEPSFGGLPTCDYSAMVARASDAPQVGVWPISLRDTLPVLPVPLGAGEPDATLELQPALHTLYDEACYGLFIYDGDPEPPLSAEDAAWAAALIPPRA